MRFYTNTLHRQVGIERIPLPRYEKKLPVILSREEVKLLLDTPKNLGHRTILTTMYAAGLRVSEVANLKAADIERPGEGKSGGYRSVILNRHGDKAFFVYGFPKSERDSIDQAEERLFR